MRVMARAAATADAFTAVAEPRRREILDVLSSGERAVGELVHLLGVAQPQVSKHLRVLREVGIVAVRDDGRRRLYRVDGSALRPIHDWVTRFERSWSERFDELDYLLEGLRREERMEMASSRTATVTLPADEQILITREFDAPRHLVYRAWTTPELRRAMVDGGPRRGDDGRDRPARRGCVALRDGDARGSERSRSTASTASSSRTSGSCRPRSSRATRERGRSPRSPWPRSTVARSSPSSSSTRPRADRDAHVESGMEDGLQDALDLLEGVAGALE